MARWQASEVCGKVWLVVCLSLALKTERPRKYSAPFVGSLGWIYWLPLCIILCAHMLTIKWSEKEPVAFLLLLFLWLWELILYPTRANSHINHSMCLFSLQVDNRPKYYGREWVGLLFISELYEAHPLILIKFPRRITSLICGGSIAWISQTLQISVFLRPGTTGWSPEKRPTSYWVRPKAATSSERVRGSRARTH